MRRLPIVRIGATEYFVDERLRQIHPKGIWCGAPKFVRVYGTQGLGLLATGPA